jgi:hypothetical protein
MRWSAPNGSSSTAGSAPSGCGSGSSRPAPGSGCSAHDTGPGLERAFGKDELETFLEVERVHLTDLTAASGAEWTDRLSS